MLCFMTDGGVKAPWRHPNGWSSDLTYTSTASSHLPRHRARPKPFCLDIMTATLAPRLSDAEQVQAFVDRHVELVGYERDEEIKQTWSPKADITLKDLEEKRLVLNNLVVSDTAFGVAGKV